MTWWMACFTPEIPDKFSLRFGPQMKGILHTRFSAPQGRQAGRNGLRHGSGVKKRKKKSLSTPFRRLRFTQCRWAHHFTKLHIIGFVYYSSLLTFHYVGDCIRRVIAGAIQSIGAIGAIGETRACERNNQNDRHAWPWLGGVKAECFGMFPAAGEMCTTSVRTSRCSVEGGGKKKRNKQNPTKKCPFRKKPNRSAVPTARCKYRNARNWRRRIY